MMDTRTIATNSRSSGRKAKNAGKKPKQFDAQDLCVLRSGNPQPLRLVPDLGDYRPKGYDLQDTHFVDASGFGAENEPAMTIARFCKLVSSPEHCGHSWGIIEIGQFQVYIGEFVPHVR